MDAFRQRKPIVGRSLTRSRAVSAVKPEEPKQAADLALLSKKRLAPNVAAAPNKQRRKKALPTSDSAVAELFPPSTEAQHPADAAKSRKQRSKKAQPPRQPMADASLKPSTADLDTAQPSNAAAGLQAAPSGMPAALPSGLPPDPALLHCWTKESMREAAAYLAEKDAGQALSVQRCYTAIELDLIHLALAQLCPSSTCCSLQFQASGVHEPAYDKSVCVCACSTGASHCSAKCARLLAGKRLQKHVLKPGHEHTFTATGSESCQCHTRALPGAVPGQVPNLCCTIVCAVHHVQTALLSAADAALDTCNE